MTLGTLVSMSASGALKMNYTDGDNMCTLGGVVLDSSKATLICSNLGWLEMHLSPFEILKKTNKFVNAVKKSVLCKEFEAAVLDNTVVTFQNFRSNTYGKTYDRIVLQMPYGIQYTIIYGMENQGAAYVVYKVGSATPVAKCRNIAKVAEYIVAEGLR